MGVEVENNGFAHLLVNVANMTRLNILYWQSKSFLIAQLATCRAQKKNNCFIRLEVAPKNQEKTATAIKMWVDVFLRNYAWPYLTVSSQALNYDYKAEILYTI